MKTFLFIALLIFASSEIKCQLVAGDIAFIGYNEDAPTDGFSIITLTDIPGSAAIYFTDQGISTSTAWVGNTEDHWRFTAPAGGISCGTIISFTEVVADAITITGVSGASMVHLSGTGLFNLSGGDQMIAYTVAVPGVPASPTTATFIAAITLDDGNGSPTCLDVSTGWSSAGGCIGTSVNRSLVPPGLTNGVNCVAIFPTIGTELDNVKYNGTLTGTSASIRAAINNRTNWLTDDLTNYNISPGGYASPSITCGSPCAVVTVSLSSQINVLCFGGTNGAATVSASGGSSFTYSWSPSGGSAATASGLAAGTYICTITNDCGNSAMQSVTITAPTVLALTSNAQTNVSCFGGTNGAASVNNATGGAGSYTYNWTPGTPTGDGTTSVTGLSAGTWTCTVTDANNCTATRDFTITAPSILSLTSNAQTNVSCFGGSNGAASVQNATGGAGGYSYNWTGSPFGDGTTSVAGLSAGDWTCTVTDANNCTATRDFTITAPSILSLTSNAQTNVSCFGGSNGAASVQNATGGAGGYSYDWTGSPFGDGTTSVAGLSAGDWTCTVTDANSCTATRDFTITAPTALALTANTQTNVSCFGETNGAAIVNNATGGTIGYTYDWTPGTPTGDGTISVTGLGAGTWTCTVTDGNGCTATQDFDVTEPAILTADSPSDVSECDSYTLPALTVGNYFTEANGTGTALTAGDVITTSQTIYVYATNGICSDENSFEVTINATPVADAPGDVSACDSYILPALTIGNYFTEANGTGIALTEGDAITTSQTIYVYAANGTCTDENSFEVTINTTPNITSTLGASRCDEGTLTLEATPNAGTIDWFADATGGTSLFTGTSFTTPSLTSTTTYYAEVANGSCVNATREAVVAKIGGCTKIQTSQCGTTITNVNTGVWAKNILGATDYKFEITDPSSNVTVLEGTSRNFKFSQFAFVNNTTYNVRVSAKTGSVYSEYGASCSVRIEQTSKIQTSQCGVQIATPTTNVWSRIVTGATGYRFELTDQSNNVTILDNPTRSFKYNQFTYIPGEVYSVRVSAKTGSYYAIYGAACNVTAPATIASRPQEVVELKSLNEPTFDFEAFPNPSNGDFTISSSEAGTFKILNELGQLIRTVEITEANGNQVNVENMPNGAYFVTGRLNGEAVTKKVIVVR